MIFQKSQYNQTSQYHHNSIVYLADQSYAPQKTPQIARATRVPAGCLAKVMQGPNRSGLVCEAGPAWEI